jgi:alpha-L-arabinofuranosidase
MWMPVNAGSKGSFALDRTSAFNGSQSQVLQRSSGNGITGVANQGLNRWGIAVKTGRQFQGSIYLRAQHLQGPVTLALQSANGQKTYAVHTIANIPESWSRYAFSLTSGATDPKARFVVYIAGPGKLWIDQATLMAAAKDQFKGLPLRADIAVKMQQEGLNFLRYGGTMVNAPEYRWKKMIGPREKRPPYKGHWYPCSTNGFGIEDFLQYCEAAGFEAAFAINIEENAQDAADLAEYLKGDTTTVWGRKRAQYGHLAPYKVKYIEIGNEEVLFDGDVAEQYDHYIERFNAIYNAMHAKDTSLQFINSVWWRPNSPNSEKLFKALSGKAAYWDFHVDGDSPRAGAKVDRDLTKMRALFKQWAPQSTMKCAIFEENGGLHNLQRALGHATILNAVRRHGDFVLTSCAANALQPLHQNDNGWDQGQIFFTPSEVWGMPPFYAQQMAARNHLPLRCYSRATNGLDVTATRSQNGKVLVLHIINPGDTACAANIGIQHFSFTQPVAVSTLAGNLADENTVTQPEKVHTKHTQLPVPRNGIRYTFPAHSYTILRFE